MNSYVLYYVSWLPLEARSLSALLPARCRHMSSTPSGGTLVTIGRMPDKAWRVRLLPLLLYRLPLFLRGASLALSTKRRSYRCFAPSTIMHSTSTPITSTPVKADNARRCGGHGRSKGHATDGACTRVHGLLRHQRLHQHLHGALSRQGVIHIDIYTESPPTRDGGHIKSTLTSTTASSTSFKRRQGEAILHRHILLR
jgi:hypothetical protein